MQYSKAGFLFYLNEDMVMDPEPLLKTHLLRKMENVILTPHISGVSWEDNNHTKNILCCDTIITSE
ncbi:MAG: hypothetical protein K6G64_00280 [Eubacterium sp.]|nr:hypothetical protein [Eubacterium sp.]